MLYALLIRLFSPVIFLITLLEATRRQGGWRFLAERFGGYRTAPTSADPTWIHCASVGEVKAAEALINALILQETPLLITTNTPTGAKLVTELFRQKVMHSYLPLDYPSAIRRFLKHHHPRELWVVETEIWPNLYRLTHQQGVPIQLINARLSIKTLKSPAWVKRLYRQTLRYVSHIYARNPSEANRFRQLGADDDKLQVLGNLKYAGLTPQPDYPNPLRWPDPDSSGQTSEYVLAASTHAEEEAALVELWQGLNRPERLVLVPRHPKRRQRILKRLVAVREQLAVLSLNEPITPQTHYFLYDRIGGLMPLYQHAKLVIMGGAFVAKGGHNLLEPAAMKACIVTGPDMSDFEEETQQLIERNGVLQCRHLTELQQQLPRLLDHPEERQAMGQAAYQLVVEKSHLLDDYLAALGNNTRQ